jgi:tRNA (cmo5U34)-methyltransferase
MSAQPARRLSAVRWEARGNMMSGIEDYFNSIKDKYSEDIKKINPCYIEMISATLGYFPNEWKPSHILELGCGTGNLTLLVKEGFPKAKIMGVDLSGESIKVCRDRINSTNVKLLQSDLRTVSFKDDCFDVIISSLTIHHLQTEERSELYRKARNWLKPKGWLIICDRYRDDSKSISDINRSIWHKKAIENGATPEEWDKWMKHEIDHDHPGKLIDQLEILQRDLHFTTVDVVWRKYLWAVIYAQK